MKFCYYPKTFRRKSLRLLEVCNSLIETYRAQGYELTLRQLYYQMIAGDHFPDTWIDSEYNAKHGLDPDTKNTDKNYDKFGSLLSDARLAGLVDWEAIVDRGRALRGLQHWNAPGDIIAATAASFHYDLWADQPRRVEVWVEKDALSDVIGRPANRYDVPFFACKGYTSQSEMWGAAMRILNHMKNGQQVVILHLGDHDPSGVDMTRDIQDRLAMFCAGHGYDAPDVRRIALTMEQIHQYNPPPNPAKLTDCRATKYIEEFGRDSWELDALTPPVMEALITEHLDGLVDKKKFKAQKARQKSAREELSEIASDYDNVLNNKRELETIHDCLEQVGVEKVSDVIDLYSKETEKWQVAMDEVAAYKEAQEDKRRLTRQLDVIWNGETGAAKQASLCDVVCQIETELPALRAAAKELVEIKKRKKNAKTKKDQKTGR